MANFNPMRTRLKEAFSYLKVERKLDQKAVAALMNTSETTISRNISAAGDERVNTDFLIRLNNAVGNVFNIQYIIDGTALIGHVATIPEERGKFHARSLLYWIGERLTLDGFCVKLFARPNRVSYYEEIGFKEIGTDIVLERINDK